MLYIFVGDAAAGDKGSGRGAKSAAWELSDVLVCDSVKKEKKIDTRRPPSTSYFYRRRDG